MHTNILQIFEFPAISCFLARQLKLLTALVPLYSVEDTVVAGWSDDRIGKQAMVACVIGFGNH